MVRVGRVKGIGSILVEIGPAVGSLLSSKLHTFCRSPSPIALADDADCGIGAVIADLASQRPATDGLLAVRLRTGGPGGSSVLWLIPPTINMQSARNLAAP